jgi:hypothetical protein
VAERGSYKTLMKKGEGGLLFSMIGNMKESFAQATENLKVTSDDDILLTEGDGSDASPSDVKDSPVAAAAGSEEDGLHSAAGRVVAAAAGAGGAMAATGTTTTGADLKQEILAGAKLTTTEEREMGHVDSKVYAKWASAAGGVSVGITIILLFGISEVVSVIASWWLSYWSQHVNDGGSPWFYLGIYVVINALISICMLTREYYARMRSLEAGRELFSELLTAVLFSPMEFYDTTPLGRIVNRFSKDIYTIDEQIPQTVRWYLGSLARVASVLLYICIITPLFIIALLPIGFFYGFTQRFISKQVVS